jgi:hypothetical protein
MMNAESAASNLRQWDFHCLPETFPMICDDEFRELVKSIKETRSLFLKARFSTDTTATAAKSKPPTQTIPVLDLSQLARDIYPGEAN